MNLEVIGRHIDVTAEIRDVVTRRAEKLEKFFDRIHGLRVIIAAEGSNNQVEFVAHLVKSDMVVAKAAAADLYTAIESAAEKLEHQLRRYKEKLRDHRAKGEEPAAPELPEEEQ